MKYPLKVVDSGDTHPAEQAQSSSANPLAGTVQMRILIELQVISMLLHNEMRPMEDLAAMRRDIAQSM